MTQQLPVRTDTLVVGGGSAGAAVAGLVAGASDERVLLVEAGADHGPFDSGKWPEELLDASQLPLTDDWQLTCQVAQSGRSLALDRAKVIGGCSAHNGCQVVVGHRRDYDSWAEAGNDGWSADDLAPFIDAAMRRIRTRRYRDDEITPFHDMTLAAMAAAGIPRVEDLNDLDEVIGAAPNPANVVGTRRFNSAFAYLDPVRHRANLTIAGHALCDRLLLRGSRVTGAEIIVDGARHAVQAERVVVSAGAYLTPAILQRSGIGDPGRLRRAGLPSLHALPGVGRNLQDHPAIELRFAGTPELEALSRRFARRRFHPEEQVVAKARSSRCREAFDLHLYTQGGARRAAPDAFIWEYMAGVLETRSRGAVEAHSDDPRRGPHIDHAFLSDPDGEDLVRLAEGFQMLRAICAHDPAPRLLGAETQPGADVCGNEAVTEAIRLGVVHAYHPGGTAKMGPSTDPQAVVDDRGRLHGLTGGYVADASVMPVLPRANTHLPTVVVAERIASALIDPGAERPVPVSEEALT